MNRQDAKVFAKGADREQSVAEEVEAPIGQRSALSTLGSVLSNPYFTLISRLVLGGIFLLAGLSKLGDVKGLKDSIDAYEMGIPAAVRDIMATALPYLE